MIAALAVLLFSLAALTFAYVYAPSLRSEVMTVPQRVHAALAAKGAPYTPLRDIAPNMRHAIVALEDRRFYSHHGIDARSMLRALLYDARSWRLAQGGSTLDEQLVQLTLVPKSDSLRGAVRTLGLGWELDHAFSKQEILELYLNAAYYGRGAYGIGTAAERYFNVPPSALDVAQAAFLASLVQAPSFYGSHPYSAILQSRWHTAVRDMSSQGYISSRQTQRALSEPLRLAG